MTLTEDVKISTDELKNKQRFAVAKSRIRRRDDIVF